MARFAALLLAGVMTMAFGCATFAQDATAPPKETNVEADEMEVIDAENKTIFRGNVVALRDTTTIKSDELVINNVDVKQPDGTTKSEVDVMHAKGHVFIKTESETITSEFADIHDRENTLEAWGKVKLLQDNNVVKGERLNVNMTTKHTVMKSTGKGRVSGSFVPK
jgi:lipopolysaccharide export system protein LptA